MSYIMCTEGTRVSIIREAVLLTELTEVVISVRNPSALAEQGRGVVMIRCGGTHLVKWLRVYRATRFNSVGSLSSEMGEDSHSHSCPSGQLVSVVMLTLVPLESTAW